MGLLLLSITAVITLTISTSHGEDRVAGTSSKAIDGLTRTCAKIADTNFGGTAYVVYSPSFSLVRNTFSFSVLTKGLRCQEVLPGQFSWKTTAITAAVEYNMDGIGGLLRVRSWMDAPELMLTDSALNLIATKSLLGGTTEETVSFQTPLQNILTLEEFRHWNHDGEAKFRLQITLRGLSRYSVNDGPVQAGGLRTGGTFILQGQIRRILGGNVITINP